MKSVAIRVMTQCLKYCTTADRIVALRLEVHQQNIALLWIYEHNFKLITFNPRLTLSEECFVYRRAVPLRNDVLSYLINIWWVPHYTRGCVDTWTDCEIKWGRKLRGESGRIQHETDISSFLYPPFPIFLMSCRVFVLICCFSETLHRKRHV